MNEATGCEWWSFDLATPQRSFGLHLELVRWPAAGRAWCWTGVLEAGRPLVTVVETDIAAPRAGFDWRAQGLWVEVVVEAPGRRWSVGLEAFALALDDPADALGACRGERIPLGYDLEWETEGGLDHPLGAAHGEVLIGAAAYEVAGDGGARFTRGPFPPEAPAPSRSGRAGALGWSPARLPHPDRPDRTLAVARTLHGAGWSEVEPVGPSGPG
ncbi:MAG: hypothetical protein ACKVWR_22900 [Acidimicrobiales bacterium]